MGRVRRNVGTVNDEGEGLTRWGSSTTTDRGRVSVGNGGDWGCEVGGDTITKVS